MVDLLGSFGAWVFLISLVVLIIFCVKKKPKRGAVLGLSIGFIICMIAGVLSPPSLEAPVALDEITSSSTSSTVDVLTKSSSSSLTSSKETRSSDNDKIGSSSNSVPLTDDSEAASEPQIIAESEPSIESTSSQSISSDTASVTPIAPAGESTSKSSTNSDSYSPPSSSVPVSINSQAVKEEATVYVWVTATGSKYHNKPNCGRTKNASEVTLQNAQAMGYEACSKCY